MNLLQSLTLLILLVFFKILNLLLLNYIQGKLKITCEKCEVQVHLGCYGLKTNYSKKKIENGHERIEFLCDVCISNSKNEKLVPFKKNFQKFYHFLKNNNFRIV